MNIQNPRLFYRVQKFNLFKHIVLNNLGVLNFTNYCYLDFGRLKVSISQKLILHFVQGHGF
jgi:hypothetical protein